MKLKRYVTPLSLVLISVVAFLFGGNIDVQSLLSGLAEGKALQDIFAGVDDEALGRLAIEGILAVLIIRTVPVVLQMISDIMGRSQDLNQTMLDTLSNVMKDLRKAIQSNTDTTTALQVSVTRLLENEAEKTKVILELKQFVQDVQKDSDNRMDIIEKRQLEALRRIGLADQNPPIDTN